MAFEAFVAAGRARSDRAQRVGVAVSLGLHVPPLILFAMQLVVRPELVDRTETVLAGDASLVVPVRLQPFWSPPPPIPEVAKVTKVTMTAVAPSGQATHAPRARKRPAPAIKPAGLALAAGGEVAVAKHPVALEPPPAEIERQAAAVGTEMLAGLSPDTAAMPALALTSGPRNGGPSAAHPGSTGELSSGAAAYLRTYETFPSLPDTSWSWGKRTYLFSLKVCVADGGQVEDVIVLRGVRPDLDAFLAAALRTWRYRPWIVSGSPRPFCHPLRITYSRG